MRKKILAVDDLAVNLEIYEQLLGERYCLELARDGREALEIASSFHPDLILLDIQMPGMNGYETCRNLRRDGSLRFVKIILVSAEAEISDRLTGYEAGADDYVTKPFHHDELVAKIEVFLRLKFAEEVDRLKTQILSLLCHETRTPLNTVIAPAEILASQAEMSNRERIEWGAMILGGARRMHGLLEKVLLLSQFKAQSVRIHAAPVDLVVLCSAAAGELESSIVEKGIRVRIGGPDRLAAVTDGHHLRLVLRAVLDNAVRFSHPSGTIRIDLLPQEHDCVISILDHGRGIDPDYLPHVFEEFSTPDVDHHSEGHGLSLALARSIMTALGGTIEMRSTPAIETCCTLRLPGGGVESNDRLRDESTRGSRTPSGVVSQ